MEHLGRRLGVEVASRQEGFPHGLVPGDVGQQPQLDLGVVRIHQNAAVGWYEHPPNLAAQVGAGGNVLEIRLRGAEPPGGSHCHLEGSVDPTVGVDGLQQAVGIGGF